MQTKVLIAAALLTAGLGLPAFAAPAPTLDDSSRGQQLDQLFQQLKAPRTPSDALAAQSQILDIWFESGDPDIDKQMQVAIQAMNEQYYDSALKVLDNILIIRPDYVEAWNQRATLYYLVGNYQASLDDIAKTLALEPRHFGAIAGKGEVYLKMGKQQDALDAFRQALALDPALTNVQAEIQMIQQQVGQRQI